MNKYIMTSKILLCPTCKSPENIYEIILSDDELPEWLIKKDYVSEFINKQKKFEEYEPKKFSQIFNIKVHKRYAGRYLLFWAADKKNSTLIKDAKKAYTDFNNHGIAKIDNLGIAKISLKCPQMYSTIPSNSIETLFYNKHFHFCISNKENNEWMDDKVYTRLIVCKLGYNSFKSKHNSKEYIIINSLPSSFYAQDHIPNSWNLHYNDAKKMSTNQLTDWFIGLLKHYPKLNKLVKNKKLSISNLPIITYCAHKDCNASELLVEELLKKGFKNIDEYPGGIKEWNKKN